MTSLVLILYHRYFGPSLSPLQQVAYRGIVEVDSGGSVHILALEDFRKSCSVSTWDSMMKYVLALKKAKTKVAFFSSTPQGGGVALMRHALVRLAKVLNVDLTWYVLFKCNFGSKLQLIESRYVPKPRPGVFRITKTVHNILQGVAEPGVRISDEEKQTLLDWIASNAKRYWLSEGGPLRPVEEGGADVIIVSAPKLIRPQ